ncbi:serine/threonine-protein kinase PknA [Halobacteriales archaeon QS_1_68_20]|nr:MAG: serine/threonine-protein kinase PknA [Halobacteriales archaeon QS_1_68_20]
MTFRPRESAVVGGRFELRERIDSGGFASVWRAVDPDGRAVAVKCGRDETHDRETVRERFRNELRCFRRMDGPIAPGALVQFVDGAVAEDVDGETVYVATELVEGESLDSLATPGVDALAAVGRPVAAALAYLHRRGVAYLDLKPNNVLRRRRGPPALIDFNAATVDGDPAPLFHQDGFKPPEQTPPDDGRAAGPRSDVYALGALGTYLLTGDPAPAEAAEDGPIDPLELGGDCSAELAAVLRTATAPDPAERYVDAGEFYAALAPLVGTDALARLEGGGCGVTVHPGATVGRWSSDGPVPDVVLADPGEHLSTVHAALERRDGAWYLEDRSLNGTFVRADQGLAYVVSEEGFNRQLEAGRTPPHPDPAESIRLADGDRIAPVGRDYGADVYFHVD